MAESCIICSPRSRWPVWKLLDTPSYKFLDVEVRHNTERINEKEKLKKEYVRLRLILNTELSAKNKMEETGTLAIPVPSCSFGIINWHLEEIQKNRTGKQRKS
jgi:hypothetical protein